ncbi:MAG: universal stress protein, partial [Pseudohongiellaceae bacterium]
AENIAADLIVMGTIGTSIVPGILIGMSAEALLSVTNTPVLTVKTKDFVTPLQISSAARDTQSSLV